MASDMKEEFEVYVKRLTTAICKDILLEKMEELCSKFEDEYVNYVQASEKVLLASESLQGEVKKADKAVKNIELNTKNSLQSISHEIVELKNNNKILFEEMHILNSQSKSDFITELGSYIEKYKKEVAMTLDAGCEQISDKLAGVITPKLLQEFINKLEENTKESKELARFINDTYKTEAEDIIKKIILDSREAQEKINSTISVHVSKVLSDLDHVKNLGDVEVSKKAKEFSDAIQRQVNVVVKYLTKLIEVEKQDRDKAIEMQTELVKQIGPSDEQMDKLNSRIKILEKNICEMEIKNEINTNKLQDTIKSYMDEQKALDQQRRTRQDLLEKRAEDLSWKIYMAFSNTALMCLFFLLIILQKPWDIMGVKNSCMIAGGLLIINLLVALLRKKIAEVIVKGKEKKKMKANQ